MDATRRAAALVERLRAAGSPEGRAGMARYGIEPERALGVRIPAIRALARETGRDHALAEALWATRVHEARILAAHVDEPARVTEAQAERWVRDFDAWDLCDQACGNLFDRAPWAHAKAAEWAGREREFEKRAGFSLMAALAVHDKTSPDAAFLAYLPLVEREAGDGRNFVRKAVSWALRQIGKLNVALHAEALACARRIAAEGAPSARWIGRDALRELSSDAVAARLRARASAHGSRRRA